MQRFVDRYMTENTACRSMLPPDWDTLDVAADIYLESLKRQFFQAAARGGDILRASSIGKPAIETFAKRHHPEWFDSEAPQLYDADGEIDDTGNTYRLTNLFHQGDTFEADFTVLAHLFGWKILESQTEMDLTNVLGYKVMGHLDFIVECPDTKKQYIIDTKTCSDRSFTTMCKNMYAERPEYVTQIALYHAWYYETFGLDTTPGWLVYNKNNSSLAWVEANRNEMLSCIQNTQYLCQLWVELADASWEDVREYIAPPAPVEEVHRKQKTGCYLLPPSMRYSCIADKVYDIVVEKNGYGKETKYVRDISEWNF